MADREAPGPGPGLGAVPAASESVRTVVVALVANTLIAVAKSGAAVMTGSASLAAEAAHSWADTGNELFLVAAGRRAARPPDAGHPLGHGREAYVWSLFAAIGLFVAGGAISVSHGVQELLHPEPAEHFAIGYAVISFVLEGISYLRSVKQAREAARLLNRDVLEHVMATSDPTLRAVFAEDAAALIGLVIATLGLAAHQLTGSAVPDAIGSILVGVLLTAVAFVLINSNRRFLVGQQAGPEVVGSVAELLARQPDVDRVTALRVEVVGPLMLSVIGRVDLAGDEVESLLAVRLRAVEARLREASPVIVAVVLGPSAPDEPPLSGPTRPQAS
ncbi:cation diffusion facilitator family transporter [Catellatospora sp. KI3]|uniref:cation diffusion facilitator family transporter n=1 Tax=Catellatospora sp. KI3 TaxID=3041620 RepID=UPI002482B8D2|nr:cation diffusion facilitator family transporter [Catellatospora sp. KI3]MDI1464124.1 cation diffusion facilitator family transporter [Catellatospora sp. KI3]